MPRIGASDLYLARVISDDENGAVYDVPIPIKKRLIKIGYEPNVGSASLDADDQVVATANAIGTTKVSINAADLTLTEKAYIFGQKIVNGVRIVNKDDVAPYIAAMWRSKKSNGKYRYEKLYKVLFAENKEEFETKKQTPAYQTPIIEGVAIPRLFDGNDIAEMDEDEPTFTESIKNNWFKTVNHETDTTPPAISSTVPENNATGVAVDTKQFAWTFSKAILSESVNSTNFFVVKDSDGSLVTGTLSQSEDKKTVTFTAAANFTAATVYIAIAAFGIKDISGNSLAANNIRKFTTA